MLWNFRSERKADYPSDLCNYKNSFVERSWGQGASEIVSVILSINNDTVCMLQRVGPVAEACERPFVRGSVIETVLRVIVKFPSCSSSVSVVVRG